MPKNHLTKNNSFANGVEIPAEYLSDPTVAEPLDVKIPVAEEDVKVYEPKVFKFAASFYLTILQRAANKNYIP